MNGVNLQNVDLNLLVVLDALLRERSATRAAAQLHVTQSAVSNALRRLRSLFNEPLFVRTHEGLVPTARAERLAPQLRALLEQTSALLGPDTRAEEPQRLLTIACTDAVGLTLLPRILPALSKQARLRIVTLDYETQRDGLASGDVDLLIGIPPQTPRGCRGELAYEDRMQCIVRGGHPKVRGRLSAPQYAALPHVELALFGEPDDRVDRALARLRLRRHVALMVPHFSSIPLAVAASDCVAALSQQLIAAYAEPLRLRVLEPPVKLPKLKVSQYWHRRAEHDAVLGALRAAVRRAYAELCA